MGNFFPAGERIFNSLIIELTAFPVNRPKRKRGYSDKGSRKNPHEIHDCSISRSTVEFTREVEPLSVKQSLVEFLYGATAPAKIVRESQEEIDYRKKINRQINQLRRIEEKRIKSLTGKVVVYRANQ